MSRKPEPLGSAIRATLFATPLGTGAVAWTATGIKRVLLPERSTRACRARLRALVGAFAEAPPPRAVRALIARARRHLAGKPARFDDVTLDLGGVPPFARKVYQALRAVTPGETVSYAELAARAGSPRAARAVGAAMAHNPVPLVVPCHRVIGKGGGMGGFSAFGGVGTKMRLLALEGVELASRTRTGGDEPSPSSTERPPGSRPFFSGAGALPFDPKRALRALHRADPELGRLISQIGPFRLRLEHARSCFEALAKAIVYQQLTGKAAATIFGRLCEQVGRAGALGPEDVRAATDEALRGAGLSRAKAAALRDLAERTSAGQIPTLGELGSLEDDAIIAALTAVRGIGAWTVKMLLIFYLGRPDVLAADDFGLRKGYARAFGGELPTPRQLGAAAEKWRPWRSVASGYLWRAAERPAS